MLLSGSVNENILAGGFDQVAPLLLGGVDMPVYQPAPQQQVYVPPTQFEYQRVSDVQPRFKDPIPYKPYNDILKRFPDATAQALPEVTDGPQRPIREISDVPTGQLPGMTAQAPQVAPQIDPRPTRVVRHAAQSDAMTFPQQDYMQPQPYDPRALYTRQRLPNYPNQDDTYQQPLQQPMQPQPVGYGSGYAPQYPPQGAGPMVMPNNGYAQPYGQQGEPGYPQMNPPSRVTSPELEQARYYLRSIIKQLRKDLQNMEDPNNPGQPRMVPMRQYSDDWIGRLRQTNPTQAVIDQKMNANANATNTRIQRAWDNKVNQLNTAQGQLASMEGPNAREQFQQDRQDYRDMLNDMRQAGMSRQQAIRELYKIVMEQAPDVGKDRNKIIDDLIASGAPQEIAGFRNTPNPKGSAMQENRELKGERDKIKLKIEQETFGDKIASSHARRERLEKTNPAAIRAANARAEIAEIDAEIKRTYGNDAAKASLERRKQLIAQGANYERAEALKVAKATISQYNQKQNLLNNAPTALRPKIQAELNSLKEDYDNAVEVQSALSKATYTSQAERGAKAEAPKSIMKLDSNNPAHKALGLSILREAGGDVAKAKELAKSKGYEFD